MNARVAYFSSLRAEACSVALIAVTDVELKYDMAKVSVTVTSQIVFFPACQGVSVRPSGCFPSERDRPASFLIEEMPARLRA